MAHEHVPLSKKLEAWTGRESGLIDANDDVLYSIHS